jgi:poly-gamma-glutamate synthesis protein (capsule biosynthesis protein)
LGIKIAAAGDTLARRKGGGDPFIFVRHLFYDADISFLNLETVLTNREPVAKKWIHLRTDPENIKYLKDLGIDVVNIIHNHTYDYGVKGFFDTYDYLAQAGIIPCGIKENGIHPVVIHTNGLKVATIGFSYDRRSLHKVFDQVRELRRISDILIVSAHWGEEHMAYPSPAQVEFAHDLIDHGVHLVLGHHPHRIQGIERYKNGLIAYSLGNFNFWQFDVETSWMNRTSMILQVELDETGVLDYDVVEIHIGEDYSPRPDVKYTTYPTTLMWACGVLTEMPDWDEWYEQLGWPYISRTLKSFAVTIPKYGWVRVKKLFWWLRQEHTWKAFRGALRSLLNRRL